MSNNIKKTYIGRIRLSKEDSNEWYGKPPFMYVEKDEAADRANINNARIFNSKERCEKALRKSFKEYGHYPESKMEIMTLVTTVENIEQI